MKKNKISLIMIFILSLIYNPVIAQPAHDYMLKSEYDPNENYILDLRGLILRNYQVTTIKDEDDLVSDSNTALATQQSIKAYVDALGLGEANTASNAGTGAGLYYQKTGVDLEFYSIKSENDRLSIAIDGGTLDLEFTLVEANIDHNALANYIANQHIDWTSASDNFSTSGTITGGFAAGISDYDKFLVSDTGIIKYRTGTQVLSDIGASPSTHLHDGETLQHDGVNSDGGAYSFSTTGLVTFNQSLDISDNNLTSVNRIVGFDALVYFDIGTDGTASVEADTSVTIGSTATNTYIGKTGAVIVIGDTIRSDTANTDDIGTEALYMRKSYWASLMSFEGATDDTWQTTFSITDPTTSDKTITFQDANGIVVMDVTACTDIEGTDLAIAAGVLNFTNDTGYITGNETITLSGDVSGSGATAITTTIGNDKILEVMLIAVNGPTDEYSLTYEATTGDFEWELMLSDVSGEDHSALANLNWAAAGHTIDSNVGFADYDLTSVNKVEGFDAAVYLDIGTDGTVALEGDVSTIVGSTATNTYIGKAGADIIVGETVRSDTDNTDDLGTSGIGFRDARIKRIAYIADIYQNDNESLWSGTGQDSRIWFDSDSLNLTANLVTATDDIELTAETTKIDSNLVIVPSSTQNITAAGGITVTKAHMRIQGDGGPIDITADPQIVAGTDGQRVMLEGESNTNTVKIDQGTGIHLHGGSVTLGLYDVITFYYDSAASSWEEIGRNIPFSEKAWAFMSRDAASGTNYIGGFYKFATSDNDFNPVQTFGTANSSYAAHFFIVTAGGAGTGDTVVRITGTSITDGGVRAAGATEDLTIASAEGASTYHETPKKWLGQISIVKISGDDVLMNYGYCKYWDNNNNDFQIIGFEATWLGAKNDNTPDILLRHHKATGWTYNNGAAPTPPTALASMATDHNTEILIITNEEGAWKRDNFATDVSGADIEGTIIELVTTTNRTYAVGNFMLRIRAK